MAVVQMLTKIGIIIGSFLIGLIFVYVTNPSSKENIKQQFDMIGSQLTTFVIYIWVGKIIIHLKLFIQDPLAVLAYPSDSRAFTIAIILFVLTIAFQAVIRKKISVTSFMTLFVPVLLAASFVFEFIQQTIYDANTFMHLALLMILLLAYIIGNKSLTFQLLLFIAWATGLLIISYFTPFVMLFGFMLSTYLLLGIIGLCLVLYVYNRKEKVE